MDVFEIVKQWLDDHECDGLKSYDGECMCAGAGVVMCGDCRECRPFKIVEYEDYCK